LPLFDKSICKNEKDFKNYINLEDIENTQFISYKTPSGAYFGFHIDSIIELFKRKLCFNPYTREKLPYYLLDRSNELKYRIKNPKKVSAFMKTIKNMKSLCKDIRNRGYIIKYEWIMDLNINKLRQFYRNLYEIWTIRSSLSIIRQNQICPDKILKLNPYSFSRIKKIQSCRNYIYSNMNSLVNTSADVDDQILGILYILCSLRTVSVSCNRVYFWLNI
jgi:hypothetical protein